MWEIIKEHFNVENKEDLLEHFYTKFDKAFIASLCQKLALCAREGDELSLELFKEAGEHLARAVSVVSSKASDELKNCEGGLHVLCVGSVWLSWSLLKPGFVSYILNKSNIHALCLMRLTTTMAIGAAYMAADRLNINLPRDYEKNYEILDRINKDDY